MKNGITTTMPCSRNLQIISSPSRPKRQNKQLLEETSFHLHTICERIITPNYCRTGCPKLDLTVPAQVLNRTASIILFSFPCHLRRFCSPEYAQEIAQTIDKEKCGRADVSPSQSIPRANIRKCSPAHPHVRGVDMTDVGNGQGNHVITHYLGLRARMQHGYPNEEKEGI